MADEPKIIEIKVQEEQASGASPASQEQIDIEQAIQDFYVEREEKTTDAISNLINNWVDEISKSTERQNSVIDATSNVDDKLNDIIEHWDELINASKTSQLPTDNQGAPSANDLTETWDSMIAAAKAQGDAADDSARALRAQSDAAFLAAASLGGDGGGSVPPTSTGGGGFFGGGGLAKAAGVAGIALLATGAAAVAFNAAVQSMTDELKSISPDVALAAAGSRLQELADRFQKADEIGGQVASLESIRSDIASNIRGIFREGIELLGPPLEAVGTLLSGITGTIEGVLSAINGILDFLPGWRDQDQEGNSQFKAMQDRLDKINKLLGESRTFRDMMHLTDSLFDPMSIPLDLEAIKQNVQAGKPVSARSSPTQPGGSGSSTGASGRFSSPASGSMF